MLNTVLHGDALQLIPTISKDLISALITDPPYSSGGAYRGDRQQSTRDKYLKGHGNDVQSEYAKHNFTGDNLDQRAWTSWTVEWLHLARQITVPGGVAAVFTDWRQLPALTDTIQWAGWIWRGVLVWDKKNSRPQPGRPRQQCEFIVWASNGPLDIKRDAPFMPGIYTQAPPTGESRVHQTEKPIALMRELVPLCIRGGVILDPFAGSGSTLAAAILEGFQCVGIEKDDYYVEIARQRLREAMSTKMFGGVCHDVL